MSRRILYVAYPMVALTTSVAGGAEQLLSTLEQEMNARGHDTSVAACRGSMVSGRLIPTGAAPEVTDADEERNAEHEAAVLAEIARARRAGEPYDLVHDHGGSFWRRAREVDVPVLATLHLPYTFYPAEAFRHLPANLYFNCVSASQLRTFNGVPQLMGAIANGIRAQDFPAPAAERDRYLLWVGRICVEKGPHVAIEVARLAGVPLVLAGGVHRFSYHRAYFEREIAPHVDGKNVHFVGALSFEEKTAFMRRARAVLIPSLVDETSSLVGMEAMACGTPVLAFGRGALPEVVRDGVTGLLVYTTQDMADAVARVGDIDPAACREHVERNFSSARMADEYERMYSAVLNARLASSVRVAA